MSGPAVEQASDYNKTPTYTVDEIRSHDSEYINPLPRRTNHHVDGLAVQGRRDMLHYHASHLLALAKAREAFQTIYDAFGNTDYSDSASEDHFEAIRDVAAKALRSLPPQPTAPTITPWQPIESAPKHKEVVVYREDAGTMLGIYTSPDQFVGEHEWDKIAAELGDSFEQEDWFLFCWDGSERVEGREIPTHWMPLPLPPQTVTK